MQLMQLMERETCWVEGQNLERMARGGLGSVFLHAWALNACTSFFTGLLNQTIGLLLPDRPSDGPIASVVI